MSGPRRLAVFLSVAWLGVFLLLSSVDEVFPTVFFLVVGVAPVALAWGIGWVVAAFKNRRHSPNTLPDTSRNPNPDGFHIGWPEQAAAFAKRNSLFVARLSHLRATFDKITNRDFTTAEHID